MNLNNSSYSNGRQLNLAYIIGTYPLLTTTFIDREIRMLREWGVNVQVVSIRRPANNLSPEQELLQRDVTYLLPVSIVSLLVAHLWFLLRHPLKLLGTFFYLLTRPHPSLKVRFKTILHFVEGVYAAYLLRESPCKQVHAHFVDRAATLAMIISRLLDIPYSATAHANDIYVNPVLLTEKMANAKFIATCTDYNRNHLETVVGNGAKEKVSCIYHGLDVSIYNPPERKIENTKKPLLIATGQLCEKKGFTYLLKACRMLLDRGYDFSCQIIGEGPLRETLTTEINQLSLKDTVTLCGALPHQEVINKYQQATIFVLPCVTSADGDRDGIPNVILEALAMELPVVSTHHSGIPEVVEGGFNGLLVTPADEEALADALAELLDNPALRQQFGQRGRVTVVEYFSVEQNVKRLLAEFEA